MDKKTKIMAIICFIIVISSFIFTFIDQYKFTKINQSQLTMVTETFDYYITPKYNYEIICESGNEYKLSYILADDEHLEMLKKGDTIVLSLYDDRVVEMSVNGTQVLTIDDCIASYSSQIKILLILAPICIIVLIVIFTILNHVLNKKSYTNNCITYKTKTNVTIDNKLYNSIQKSIYKKDGYIRCNILEQLDCDDYEYTFYKAIVDYINDNEVVVMIDDGCKDNEMAFIFYKNNNKLYQELLFREGEAPFEIDTKLFSWEYPLISKASKDEERKFKCAVNEYILNNSELLKIK